MVIEEKVIVKKGVKTIKTDKSYKSYPVNVFVLKKRSVKMPQIKDSYESASILANDLIGGKWKAEVLWNIIHGHNRFSMIKRGIPEISEKVLYTILKELEDTALLLKEVVDERPPKTVLYHLNPEHNDLRPLIESIYEFSHNYAGKKKIKLRKLVVNRKIHT